VEDDLDIADSLRDVFVSRGFRVWSASNGQDAIATVKRGAFRPDVILLDLLMPVMDGLAFLATRTDEPLLATAPVIVISAQLQVLGGFREQVYAALAKPLDLRVLLETVDRACHGAPPKE
jgi:two-component system, chemotaxis family, chemotaxis protein CheY